MPRSRFGSLRITQDMTLNERNKIKRRRFNAWKAGEYTPDAQELRSFHLRQRRIDNFSAEQKAIRAATRAAKIAAGVTVRGRPPASNGKAPAEIVVLGRRDLDGLLQALGETRVGVRAFRREISRRLGEVTRR